MRTQRCTADRFSEVLFVCVCLRIIVCFTFVCVCVCYWLCVWLCFRVGGGGLQLFVSCELHILRHVCNTHRHKHTGATSIISPPSCSHVSPSYVEETSLPVSLLPVSSLSALPLPVCLYCLSVLLFVLFTSGVTSLSLNVVEPGLQICRGEKNFFWGGGGVGD